MFSLGASTSRGLGRTAAVGLALVAALGVCAPTADAAPQPAVVSLDVPAFDISVYPLYGPNPEPDGVLSTGPVGLGSHTVAYGGTLTVSLPPAVEAGPSFAIGLELRPAADAPTTRTYSSTSAVPADQLVVTDLGGKRYRVDLPADDGINGDAGLLSVYGLVAAGGTGVQVVGVSSSSGPTASMTAPLAFGSAPSNVDMPVGVVVENYQCGNNPAVCSLTRVRAGSSIELVLPSSSVPTALGLQDLRRSAGIFFGIGPEASSSSPTYALSGTLSADGRSLATVIPRNMAAGTHALFLEILDSSGTVFFRIQLNFEVTAANSGLRSNTGWGENADTGSSTGMSPLVALGAGMVLVAGLGTAAVLRPRRRAATTN